MSLKISEKSGTFFVNGKINTSTLHSFETYFQYNLSQSNKVIMNIDDVIEIDKSGLEIIRSLKNKALLENKMFSVVGYGCKEIYDDFNHNNAA